VTERCRVQARAIIHAEGASIVVANADASVDREAPRTPSAHGRKPPECPNLAEFLMIAEPNPNHSPALDLEFDLDGLDEALARSIERATDASGRVVLRRGGVPIALVVPVGTEASGERRVRDWNRIRAVLGEVRSRFADVPTDDLQAAIDQATAEAGDEVWRERAVGDEWP
jgi:hypothetical protein